MSCRVPGSQLNLACRDGSGAHRAAREKYQHQTKTFKKEKKTKKRKRNSVARWSSGSIRLQPFYDSGFIQVDC